MNAKYRPTRRATLAGLSSLALAAGRAAADAPKKGGTLTFVMNAEPQFLIALTTTATPALTSPRIDVDASSIRAPRLRSALAKNRARRRRS